MKKTISILVLLLSVANLQSQKAQSVAYIDMEYILENVPEYLQAQNTLDSKVVQWKKRLDDQERYIEILKTDLANEKAILTQDLIEEKEEEISLKQEELRRLESLYFGPNGDLFNLRKQLVAPVQDQIYNAVQDIANLRKYDFVLDKSSEPIMLYSNKKYDISELVLATINKDRKIEAISNKTNRVSKVNNPKVAELKKEQKKIIAEKKEELAEKIEEKKTAQQEAEERRAKAIKLREEKRKLLREKQEAQRKKKEEEKKKREEAKKKKEDSKKEDDNN